jgi:hypothetical protein
VIGSSDDSNIFILFKTIDFGEELIDRSSAGAAFSTFSPSFG